MLYQQMASPDLPIDSSSSILRVRAGLRSAVMLGHVRLQLLGIGSLGRLPLGDLLRLVEVVRQILGVGVAHLPAGGKT